jgi:hypothetical protein
MKFSKACLDSIEWSGVPLLGSIELTNRLEYPVSEIHLRHLGVRSARIA